MSGIQKQTATIEMTDRTSCTKGMSGYIYILWNEHRLNIYKPIIWEGENDKFASDICTIEFWVGLLCVSITKVCLTLEGYTLFGPFRVSTTKVCLKVTQMSKCFFLGPLCISITKVCLNVILMWKIFFCPLRASITKVCL